MPSRARCSAGNLSNSLPSKVTPPELAGDIYRRGLYLTGGGALLRGLDKRLGQKIKLPVHIADDPLKSVVRGTGIALKNYDRYPFVMR